jgi:hypothetical protein
VALCGCGGPIEHDELERGGVCWFFSFGWIERIFGYGGLALLVFVAAALHFGPDWHRVGNGFVPQAQGSTLYWYFAVGLVAAAFMPYEIYCYSSGARGGLDRGGPRRQPRQRDHRLRPRRDDRRRPARDGRAGLQPCGRRPLAHRHAVARRPTGLTARPA